MSENDNMNLPELTDEQKKLDSPELTEEQKKQLQDYLNDQATKLGEVFSQCWESEVFKKAFIENPKAIFDEYGVAYKKDSNYKVIDTPDKTIIHVLPYKGVKQGMQQVCDILMNHVKDLKDDEEKQVLLEGWSWQIYQNTEDTFYLPLPICPENLSPEELELVNGGCLVLLVLMLFEAAAAVTTAVGVTTTAVATWALAVVAVDTLALLAVGAVAVALVIEAVAGFTTLALDHTVSEVTGAYLFTWTPGDDQSAGDFFHGRTPGQSSVSVDPRKRGR